MGGTRALIRFLVTLGLYIGGLLLLSLAQGLLDAAGIFSYLDSLIPFVILHLALLAWLFWRMWRDQALPEYREAQRAGLAARARVLEVRRSRWRRRRGWGPWSYEHLIDLEVERPGAPPQRAEVALYLPRDAQPPAVGATLAVRVHPRRPAVVVLDAPQMPTPDGR